MTKRNSYYVIGTLTLLVLILVVLVLLYNDRPRLSQTNFNRLEWIEGTALERGRMIDDLIESDTLIGKHRKQVTELLGPPDMQGEQIMAFTVDIGQRWFWFGSPWYYQLYIHFGSKATVQKVGYSD